MRRIHLAILTVMVAFGTVFFLTRDGEDANDLDVDALARRQAQREAEALAKAINQKTNLDALAEQGLGQAVPDYLVSQLDRSGNFWFVGKPGGDVGVEIPFEPGKLPAAKSSAAPLRPNPGFLGADKCRPCHEEKHSTFVQTAHHRTSRLASATTISAPFEEGRNKMRTRDPNVEFTMLRREGDFFQRVSFFDWQFEVPFHLIIGSSKMAETYLKPSFPHGASNDRMTDGASPRQSVSHTTQIASTFGEVHFVLLFAGFASLALEGMATAFHKQRRRLSAPRS